MSRSVTLANLITQCRDAADMSGSTFVSDSEITTLINVELAELYDLLVGAYGDEYYAATRTFVTVPGTTRYALEGTNINGAVVADVYKVLRVLVDFGSNRVTRCERFNPDERASYITRNQNWLALEPRFFVTGAYVEFEYAPQAVHTVTVWYVPCAPVLATGGTTSFDFVNGYERYVVAGVAAKLLAKEESDPSVMLAEKAFQRSRIESAAKNRTMDPPTIIMSRVPRVNRFARRFD